MPAGVHLQPNARSDGAAPLRGVGIKEQTHPGVSRHKRWNGLTEQADAKKYENASHALNMAQVGGDCSNFARKHGTNAGLDRGALLA